jgi:hypothetical protein
MTRISLLSMDYPTTLCGDEKGATAATEGAGLPPPLHPRRPEKQKVERFCHNSQKPSVAWRQHDEVTISDTQCLTTYLLNATSHQRPKNTMSVASAAYIGALSGSCAPLDLLMSDKVDKVFLSKCLDSLFAYFLLGCFEMLGSGRLIFLCSS